MPDSEPFQASGRFRLDSTSIRRHRRPTPTPALPPQGLLALPPEIRRRILDLAVGSHLIHVGVEKQPASIFSRDYWRRKHGETAILRRYHCSVPPADTAAWLHPCWAPFAPSRPPDPPLHLLAPALTCRALRDDALAALYACNTLDFKTAALQTDDAVAALYAAPSLGVSAAATLRALPGAGLARVSSLRLLLSLPEFPSRRPDVRVAYERHWTALRGLPALRRLRVLLVLPVCDGAFWRANEDVFLKPVREMPPLELFEFVMPTVRAELSAGANVGGCCVRGSDEIRSLYHLLT